MNGFPTKILAATDGSEHAALAVRAASDLSLRAGAELHVVHVWQEPRLAMTLPAGATSEYSRASARWKREAQGLLDEQADRVRDRARGTGAAVAAVAGAHLRKGRPAEEVVGQAEELGADLVVVGSRGLGRVERLTTGSVSEGIVHLASRPTLVVRGGAGAWPPREVVVGDDASREAARAGELAARLGKLLEASVLLVSVYSTNLVSPPVRAPLPQAFNMLLSTGEDILKERAARLEGVLGDSPETMVTTGDAAAVIQEVTGESALVAVGSRGLGAVRRFTVGSVSTDVLRAAGGPVLVVPPAEA